MTSLVTFIKERATISLSKMHFSRLKTSTYQKNDEQRN